MRFLFSVIGGWALVRVAMLWGSGATLPEAVRGVPRAPRPPVVRPLAGTRPIDAAEAALPPTDRIIGMAPPEPRDPAPVPSSRVWGAPTLPVLAPAPAPAAGADPVAPDPQRIAMGLLAQVGVGPAARVAGFASVIPAQLVQPPPRPAGRWSASGWALVRSGSGLGAAPGSQLGGSQAGIRIDRVIGGGFALTGRVATPLKGQGREAALGVAWQSERLPVRIVAEQRLSIDGGRSGPALGVSGGASDVALPLRFRLEAYGQAGAIARDGVEAYADGAVRVARPLARIAGGAVELGAGAWGAAQRDAARIDVGPGVALRLPRPGGGARLSFDWRQRIAGRARPGSGPAITLAADF